MNPRSKRLLSALEPASALWCLGLLSVLSPVAGQLGSTLTQRIHQDLAGMNESAENLDKFGDALAVGDFDGDGIDDLAISAFGETLEVLGGPDLTSAGIVHVLYGRPTAGLEAPGSQQWSYLHSDLAPFSQSNSLLGAALAAGDFDGDTYTDLAIAASRYDAPGRIDVGAVFVLYGSPTGLHGSTLQRLWQEDPAVPGTAETQDFFGERLAAGDFDGDSRDDLVVLAASDAVGDENNAGIIQVFYGSSAGISTSGVQTFHQGDLGETPENPDDFADALFVGRFDDDIYEDLLIGVPEESVDVPGGFLSDTGTVHLLPGSAAGLVLGSAGQWYQGNGGIAGVREAYDNFGSAFAGIDARDDDVLRMVVSMRGENENLGALHAFEASPSGPSTSQQTILAQDSADPSEPMSEGDGFGTSIVSGDFDGDGIGDLAVGSPSETSLVDPFANGGAVQVFYGDDPSLFDLSRFARFTEDAAPIHETTEPSEQFGENLAVGDFNDDGSDDLVIGAPRDRFGPSRDLLAGAVYVLYGSPDTSRIFSDGFESGDTSSWTLSPP